MYDYRHSELCVSNLANKHEHIVMHHTYVILGHIMLSLFYEIFAVLSFLVFVM